MYTSNIEILLQNRTVKNGNKFELILQEKPRKLSVL